MLILKTKTFFAAALAAITFAVICCGVWPPHDGPSLPPAPWEQVR